MRQVTIRDEFIKLGQLLKLTGAAESGVEAKQMIEEGAVLVNGETELRRGRKVRGGDIVMADGVEYVVSSTFEEEA